LKTVNAIQGTTMINIKRTTNNDQRPTKNALFLNIESMKKAFLITCIDCANSSRKKEGIGVRRLITGISEPSDASQ